MRSLSVAPIALLSVFLFGSLCFLAISYGLSFALFSLLLFALFSLLLYFHERALKPGHTAERRLAGKKSTI